MPYIISDYSVYIYIYFIVISIHDYMGNKIWLILNREDDYHDLRSCLVREMGILLGK
jgi:hypothetical protein